MTVYVKSCMAYIQILLEFGFLLSATKEIVLAGDDKHLMSNIYGSVIYAKLVLSFAALLIVCGMMIFMDILRGFEVYVMISFAAVVINALLPDFLFRGLNRMHEITSRFVVCKAVSTGLTLLLIKSDSNLLLIPVFDLASSILAAILSFMRIRRLGIHIHIGKLKTALKRLGSSAVYFVSSAATTTFGALNTIVVGSLFGSEQVAFWGLCMQIVNAAQSMYTPIMNGIYPYMVKIRDFRLIRNIMLIFMPLILLACCGCWVWAEEIVTLVGGEKYIEAAGLLRSFIPLLIVSFPAQLFGWPSLGAINHEKEVTRGTLIAAAVQTMGIILLMAFDCFTLVVLAAVRSISELSMLIIRGSYSIKYREEFKG